MPKLFVRILAFTVLSTTIAMPIGYASIFKPLLNLLRPQLENSLFGECVKLIGGIDQNLIIISSKACRLAVEPISNCLIKQADKSGKTLVVIKEIIQSKFGDASETVVKRCIASILMLPINSFQNIPLKQIFTRTPLTEGSKSND